MGEVLGAIGLFMVLFFAVFVVYSTRNAPRGEGCNCPDCRAALHTDAPSDPAEEEARGE